MMAMRRARGFTLIELMVTVAILAIMLGIGVPSFRSFIASQRVKSASYELMTSLQIARSEAIKRNGTVSVTPGSAGAWAGGWSVVSGTTTLHNQQAVDGITVTPKDPTNLANDTSLATIDFGSSGRPAAKAYFQINGTSAVRCVWVDVTGVPSSKSRACNS